MVCAYDGVLALTIFLGALEAIVLSDRHKSGVTLCYETPLTGKTKNTQIHKGRKENGGRWGLMGMGGGGYYFHVKIKSSGGRWQQWLPIMKCHSTSHSNGLGAESNDRRIFATIFLYALNCYKQLW